MSPGNRTKRADVRFKVLSYQTDSFEYILTQISETSCDTQGWDGFYVNIMSISSQAIF